MEEIEGRGSERGVVKRGHAQKRAWSKGDVVKRGRGQKGGGAFFLWVAFFLEFSKGGLISPGLFFQIGQFLFSDLSILA
jgi:hypothetical protein